MNSIKNYYGSYDIEAYAILKDFFSLQVSSSINDFEAFTNEVTESIKRLDIPPETLYLLVDQAETKDDDLFYFDLLITILLIKGFTFFGDKFLPDIKFSLNTEDKILEAYSVRYFLNPKTVDPVNPESIAQLFLKRKLYTPGLQGARTRAIGSLAANLQKIYDFSPEGKNLMQELIEDNLFHRDEIEAILKAYNIIPIPSKKAEMGSMKKSFENNKTCNPIAQQYCDQYGETGEINCQIINPRGGLCVTGNVVDGIPRNKAYVHNGKIMYGQTNTLGAYLNNNEMMTPVNQSAVPLTDKFFSPSRYTPRYSSPRLYTQQKSMGLQNLMQNSNGPKLSALSSNQIYASTPRPQLSQPKTNIILNKKVYTSISPVEKPSYNDVQELDGQFYVPLESVEKKNPLIHTN